MNINTFKLGFRELIRLSEFIILVTEEHPTTCLDATFCYNLYADEPVIKTDSGNIFYASDFDYAFTEDNHIVKI